MRIKMVNALLHQRTDAHADTHLPDALSQQHKKQLKKHFETIAKVASCVCFQCGWLMYAKSANKILVENITDKEECRAYRVFEHYIRQLESEAQAGTTVFLCKRAGTGPKVWGVQLLQDEASDDESRSETVRAGAR